MKIHLQLQFFLLLKILAVSTHAQEGASNSQLNIDNFACSIPIPIAGQSKIGNNGWQNTSIYPAGKYHLQTHTVLWEFAPGLLQSLLLLKTRRVNVRYKSLAVSIDSIVWSDGIKGSTFNTHPSCAAAFPSCRPPCTVQTSP